MNRLDVNDLLQAIIERATRLMHTPHGYVDLVNSARNLMEERIGLGVFSGYIGRQLERGKGVSGTVWERVETVVVEDYTAWPNRVPNRDYLNLRTVIGVPLKSGRRVIGVLGLAYFDQIHRFDKDELTLLEQFAHLASLALDNASLYTAAQHELAERKQAEQALIESERRYRALFDDTNDAVALVDLEGNFIAANRTAQALLHYPADELLGLNIASITPDQEQADARRRREALFKGEPLNYERTVTSKDGELVHVELSVALVNDVAGQPHHFQAVARDVTARKRAYEQLRESEQRYRALFDYTSDGVVLIDMAGTLIAANQQMLQMLGYKEEEIAGRPFIEFIAPAEVAEARELYAAQVGGQQTPRLFERTVIAANGDEVLFEMSTGVVCDARGNPLYTQTIARNITERKQAEQQLRLLSAAVRHANDGVMITNATGDDTPIILYVNDAMCRMSGFSAAEMIGQPQSMMIGPATDRRETAQVREARKRAEPYRGEFLLYRKDQSTIWLEVGIEPIKDAAGNITNWVIISRDITSRKQYEQSLLYHSTHDYLTGLPNRRWLEDRLARLLAQMQPRGENALLFIDLDHFKIVNDTLGHVAGDEALQFVAQLLSHELPSRATLARIGGDEFALLLEQTSAAQARLVAEHLQQTVADRPFVSAEHTFPFSLSIGMVVIDQQRSVRTLIFEADTAMYVAKKQGGNRVIVRP